MGVLNVTPDSFSDGGLWLDPAKALEQAKRLMDEGADLLDIGGESTRPGASPVSLEEELRRILPVAKGLAGLPWSIDTQKAEVARQALAEGACLVNDVSALTADPAMAGLLAHCDAGVSLMHRLKAPAEAKWSPDDKTHYGPDGVTDAVSLYLRHRLKESGLDPARVWFDPGLGFGKTVSDNLRLLRELPQLAALGRPLLVGPSRKSFVGAVLDGLPMDQRLEGTLAACVIAVMNGASVLRVHDVKETVRAVKVAHAIQNA
jgi:dihydropteroate synthase